MYIISFILILIILWLSNNELKKSITIIKESEKQLIQDLRKSQTEKISQLSRAAEFGRLSSGLFHDLVNPLSAVIMNLSSIKNSIHPELKIIKDQLDRAVRASKKMDIFISSIKKQIRSDEFKEVFHIYKIIDEVISIFKYKAMKANIQIYFDNIHNKKLSIYGNPIKFHQIITNLVSNSIDAQIENIENLESKYIRIILSEIDKNIIIEVLDNGSGILPENLKRIFDRFFTTKSNDISMGLGLSTISEIVDNEFMGNISVHSQPNIETKFTVIIPKDKNQITSRN